MSNSSRFYRYLDVLIRSRFGLRLPWSGMLNYAKYFVLPRRNRIVPSRLSPVVVMLYTTLRCNLRCPFCLLTMTRQNEGPVSIGEDTPPSDMSLSYVQKILDTDVAKRTLVAVLTGGEPLLNKEIIDMVKLIKSRKKQCGMVTNGTLLQDRIADLAKAGLDDIQLSVYDATFEKLKTVLPDVCSKFSYINASYVLLKSVLRENPGHVKEVIRLCRESGCRSFKFNICVTHEEGAGRFPEETIYENDAEYDDFVKEYRSEPGERFQVYFPPGAPRGIASNDEKRCMIPWQQLSVFPNGEINMCCSYRPKSNESPGTIFDENADLSYNNEFLRAVREGLLSKEATCHEVCERCMYRTGKAFGARV